MREILFRGKRVDNVEWVYGNFFKDSYGWIGIFERAEAINAYKVIPGTVGQYTGLTDLNGTKIFEGDILSAHLDDLFPENETRGVVVYRHSEFCLMQKDDMYDDFKDGFEKMFEVIGNIYDNPELLEVEQ